MNNMVRDEMMRNSGRNVREEYELRGKGRRKKRDE
jgi:hypothetical protein